MIYFVRRSFDADKTKINHKKQLKKDVTDVLRDLMKPLGAEYCEQQLGFNDYGKPYLKNHSDIFFNISHCHQLAVCTVAKSEVGIDAEDIRSWHPRVVKRVFTEKESEFLNQSSNKNEAFFRIWTLKESFVKAIGIGISYPMKTCEFLFEGDEITVNGCDGYSFSQVILNGEFVCSLCLKTTEEHRNKLYRISRNENFFAFEL